VGEGRAALEAESAQGGSFWRRVKGSGMLEKELLLPSPTDRKRWTMKPVIIARTTETMMINILGSSVGVGVGNGSGG
jgi:hypothetical protein